MEDFDDFDDFEDFEDFVERFCEMNAKTSRNGSNGSAAATAKLKDAMEWKLFEIQAYLSSSNATVSWLREARPWLRPVDYEQGTLGLAIFTT